ncbi:dodecenoyl-CoA isomerase [Aphanomyces cochlioides]|nr:dodecenoyl-CoA isomerase [Aphanomyces cochlioides]
MLRNLRSFQALKRCKSTSAAPRVQAKDEKAAPIVVVDSSPSSLVTVERREGYAVVRMNRAPVNSLNLEMFKALEKTVADLEKDKAIKYVPNGHECVELMLLFRGLILASTNPKVFSAGLDIMEMYQPKTHRLREFWAAFQEFYLRFYTTPLATVAAIEGHAPAGGCFLAMCCDARVMATGKPVIGLNETKLGIVAPFWMKDVMQNTIGHRETEKMLGLGLQVDALTAKKIGLVDEAVEVEQVFPLAEKMLQEWLAIPGHARKATKHLMRNETAERLRRDLKGDTDHFVDFAETDRVQNALGAYIAALKKPKA